MAKILFFDGVCVMCNGLVNFALKHDKKGAFKFAPLQGKTATSFHIDKSLTSVILVDEAGTHRESDAIIRLLVGLGGIFRLAFVLKIVPRFIRDGVYRLVANHRYRWFGMAESCRMLTHDEKSKMLD